MRKTIYCLLMIGMGIFMASCNKTDHYRLGVSQCSDDDWRKKMNGEIERELLFHPEAEVEIRSADDSNEKQIADIRYFIENGFDAIIVAPNEAEALTPVISEAYNKGIPVVVFDRNVIGRDYTAWQGADNVAIGRAAAEHALKQVGSGANVIELRGLKGSTPADERHEGFISVDGLNIVGSAYGNWNYEDAWSVADSLLNSIDDIHIIYAHNDRMAVAASDAARRRGLTPYIIGIDGAPEIGMKAVADSVIDATFIYPTEGQKVIQTAMAILEGEPFDTIEILPGAALITASNVEALLLQNDEMKNETAQMENLKTELNQYWAAHSSQTAMLYAVIIIMVLLSGVLFLILRTFWAHRRHQAALEKVTASKLIFFTNVSHDLRTPLTLIAEPVSQMAHAENLTDRQRTMMKIADKNVMILKRLINQILDFRKYENNKLELKSEQADLAVLIRGWAEAFGQLARQRKINFAVDIESDCDYTTALDVEKMERIFYNIVSNAFKFTPADGTIKIGLGRRGNSLVFTVADTGKGISPDDLPMIFDRFFQADRIVPNGSGIGLALAKAFVELHGGTISADSTLGKGTVFTVVIPVKTEGKKSSGTYTPLITAETVTTENNLDYGQSETEENPGSADRQKILVIDDNADIRHLLKELLADEYSVVTAADGVEGLKKAAQYVPDLIICDVMMPEMDGTECCRRLKSDISTSHIPVLMLTACAMDEQRIEGYGVGADGYLSKPFNSGVLMARIKNLISNRKLIRELWNQNPVSEQPVQPSESSSAHEPVVGAPDIDNEFYKKFLGLVKEQMGNPDLNIEELASEMGLGRSQFYRKIKSLTDYSPVELLRKLRLARAHELLTGCDRTVSEISYEVGFSTPAYFTKCYRDAYGETPTETREKRK